jgi:hypothetical protein
MVVLADFFAGALATTFLGVAFLTAGFTGDFAILFFSVSKVLVFVL